MKQFIAERKLLYSAKGADSRQHLTVRISAPFFAEGFNSCTVEFDGLQFDYPDVSGMDSIQALELAIKVVESNLKWLSAEYDFYFADGDPYFEDDEESKN